MIDEKISLENKVRELTWRLHCKKQGKNTIKFTGCRLGMTLIVVINIKNWLPGFFFQKYALKTIKLVFATQLIKKS